MSTNIETGTLKHGLLYREQRQYAFEMREVQSAGELFDAEVEANGVQNQLAFNAALMARQLVRIGDCTGPFSIEQIRALSPKDFGILRQAQSQLNQDADDPNESSDASESGSSPL